MSYDERMIHPDLRENAADDPYGTFTHIVKEACKMAATYQGGMNTAEYATIITIAADLDRLDPILGVLAAMTAEFDIKPPTYGKGDPTHEADKEVFDR